MTREADLAPRLEGGALGRLRSLLRDGGGLMGELLGEPRRDVLNGAASPAALAAAGPRAAGRRADYELLVEAIYEGYLLHYGSPRVIDAPEADLGLLAGDRLYAIGLARLVELGDTLAVAELADTITLSALAHGSGRPELAEAAWEAGACAVGWGSSPAHRRAKEMLVGEDPRALDAMRTCVRTVPAPR